MRPAGLMLVALLLVALAGCAGQAPPPSTAPPAESAQPAPPAEAWRQEPPPPGKRGVLVFPKPEIHNLPNGLKVYLLKRPAGVVSLSVVVRCDASALAPGKSGLAALTTRMLTESTRQRSALELAEATESLGSVLVEDTGRDYCNLSLLTLPQDVGRALELLAEVVREPAFVPAEFQRVQAEWIDGLIGERQNPLRLASLAGLRLLLGETIGAPVSGSVPDVKRLTVGDLAAHHAQVFVPSRSALLVVGSVQWSELRPHVEREFGDWRGPRPVPEAALKLPPPPNQTRIVLVDKPGAVQSAVFVAQPFPPRREAGHEARQMLSSLLGELFSSRLNTNLREQHGYTYGAHSRAVATRRWGAFVVTTSVQTEVTAPALEQLRLELRRTHDPTLGHPIRDDEVQRAGANLINSLGAQLQSVESVDGTVSTLFIHELPSDYHSGYQSLVEQVSRDAVAEQAKTRLLPQRLLVVVVGDRSRIEAGLRTEGVSVESAEPKLLE